jgi:hypothetical protein
MSEQPDQESVTNMPEDVSISEAAAPRRAIPVVLASGVVGLLMAGALALWAHYGTAVFFETIRVGLVACFG